MLPSLISCSGLSIILLFSLILPTIAKGNITAAIPLYSLPTSYPASLIAQNPIFENQIRDTLAHYPLAIDGKNFAALDLVFTQDVVANYSAPLNVLTGLATVISTLKASLAPVTTQHALSTQLIEILAGGSGARSVTYFTASHFGQGDYLGQVCCPRGSSYVHVRLLGMLRIRFPYLGAVSKIARTLLM